MSAIERIEELTLEDFVRLYDEEGPFELIHGLRIPLMPPVIIHGLTARALFLALYNYCVAKALGEVVFELPFVLVYGSNWVKGARIPDVMFFAASRWEQYIRETEDWQLKPYILVPDLAVEVLSPNDSFSETQEKVTAYLRDGVKLIWVVDPIRKRVTVYQGDRFTTLTEADTLNGGEVVEGFELELKTLFAVTNG